MLWWLPPLIATVVAIFWVSLKVRREDARDGAELTDRELERMRRALIKPLPASVDITDTAATDLGTDSHAPSTDRPQRDA